MITCLINFISHANYDMDSHSTLENVTQFNQLKQLYMYNKSSLLVVRKYFVGEELGTRQTNGVWEQRSVAERRSGTAWRSGLYR